ncbi:MAG: DUF2460 domain-containing protein [Pseudomonadota bacterium]
MTPANFHEVRFPTAISRGASGGPTRRTDVVVLGSGHEERNARWADSRRSYNAGYGVRTMDDLHAVIAFFEERRGQLYGFRWKDMTDFRSVSPGLATSAMDQIIGVGDGAVSTFKLVTTYGGAHAPYVRQISKPVAGTVAIAVDGVPLTEGSDFTLDPVSGSVAFSANVIPGAGAVVTAGYEFDTPVRFATDRLEINFDCVTHGAIPAIPVTEILI